MIHSLSNTLSYVIGVEKKNDDFRRYFHRSIKKWDSCKADLSGEKTPRIGRSGKTKESIQEV